MLLNRPSPPPCTKPVIGLYARIEQLIVQWSHMSGSHFLHKPNISISGNPAKVDCLLLCDACEKWQLCLASQPDFLLLVTSCGRLCPLHHHLLPLFCLIIILDLLPCFSPHSSLSHLFSSCFSSSSPSLWCPSSLYSSTPSFSLYFCSFSQSSKLQIPKYVSEEQSLSLPSIESVCWKPMTVFPLI